MKKLSIYIISIFLVIILTISGTYAFYTTVIQKNNAISTGSHQLQVEYSGDVKIDGEIELVRTKEEGFRRELSIGLGTNSLAAEANFFIQVDNITKGFQNKALKWEIYEIIDSKENYIKSDTFEKITSGTTIYIAENLTLSTTTRNFAVYIWLYGEEAGNEVIGAELTGYIGAETEQVVGNLNN